MLKCGNLFYLLIYLLTEIFHNIKYADVVELVDTYALGAYASRREGSSPFIRTKI